MELDLASSLPTRTDGRPLRFLCVSPLFAPAADSEAFCSTKMVRALLDCGMQVSVITSESIRSKDRAYDASAMWAFTKNITSDVPLPTKRNLVYSLRTAAKYQSSFYSRWVDACMREARRLHREHRFDLVYSRSLPMIAHVVGFWCARRFRIPWVANINDPWEFYFVPGIPYPKTSRLGAEMYLYWLRRTLRNAHLVTYPCSSLWKFHTELSGIEHRAEVIPHIGSSWEDGSSQDRSIFNLVHAGKLGSSEITGRSGIPLLLALRRFFDETPSAAQVTRLTLVGHEDPQIRVWSDKLGLTSNVCNIGRVDYQRSLQFISEASVCVLVEANIREGMFFPSKLADYLVSGKPVLALSPRRGVVADMAERGGVYRVDPKDPEMIQKALADLYTSFERGELQVRGPNPGLSSQFESGNVGQRFLDLVRSRVLPASVVQRLRQNTDVALSPIQPIS